jgi:accessory gene regulator protein AgrB
MGDVHTGIRCENLREGNQVEDLGVGGRIILNMMFKKQVVVLIGLFEDMDKLRAFLNAVMSLQVP